VVKTDVFFDDGAPFAKGRGINVGMQALDGTDWVLLIDADIAVIEPIPRELLKTNLYTAKRLSIVEELNWRRLLNGERRFPTMQNCWQGGAILPSGYFQLFHRPTVPHQFNQRSSTAARDDVNFSSKWPSNHRSLLLDYYVYHLE